MLKSISKEYKCVLRKSHVNYNTKRIDKLRTLKNSKPREYWKILNSENKPKETNEFYEYFNGFALFCEPVNSFNLCFLTINIYL